MRALLYVLAARIQGFLRPGSLDADFDEEMAAHLAAAEEDGVRRGLTPDEARRVARVQLGGLAQLREASRAAQGLPWLGACGLDFRLGIRLLVKYPGLTLVSTLALAIGIAIVAGFHAGMEFMVCPELPDAHGERIVAIWNHDIARSDRGDQTIGDMLAWRQALTSVEDVGAFVLEDRAVCGGWSDPAVHGAQISASVRADTCRAAPGASARGQRRARPLRWQGSASTLGGMYRTALTLVFVLAAAAGGLSLAAQTTPAGSEQQVHADMNQLMRGVLYPAANVVFSAQADNPAEIKLVPGHDPNMSTDPLTSTFGGWTAVENAALALAESANLLAIEGRRCSTGVVAPTKHPVWAGFVRDMRAAAMKAHAAARAKDQAQMIEVADALSATCSGCHRRFRDRRTPGGRCTLAETK